MEGTETLCFDKTPALQQLNNVKYLIESIAYCEAGSMEAGAGSRLLLKPC